MKRKLFIAPLEQLLDWSRRHSLWYLSLGLGCCFPETESAQGPDFDLVTLGAESQSSPRQADVLIVAGGLTKEMAPVISRLYAQMASPKFVIALGDCAADGGLFRESSSSAGPLNQTVPVDVTLSGCPPRPEQWVEALRQLQDKIGREGSRSMAKQAEETMKQLRMPEEGSPSADPPSGGPHPEPLRTIPEIDQPLDILYRCTMHPSLVLSHPGECPLCRMGLIRQIPARVQVEDLEVLFGPQHFVTQNGLTLKVRLDGEIIAEAAVDSNPARRGLDQLLLKKSWRDLLPLLARVDPLAPISYNLAYVLVLEQLQRDEVSPASQWARLLLLEMERMASHLFWLGEFGRTLGLDILHAQALHEREKILRLFDHWGGSRLPHDLIAPGGARIAFLENEISRINIVLSRLPKKIEAWRKQTIENRLFRARTEGIGLIDAQDVEGAKGGATGPVARAAGIGIDLRMTQSGLPYRDLKFSPLVHDGSDNLGRCHLRLSEMAQSADLIIEAAERLKREPNSMAVWPKQAIPSDGKGASSVETPRGRLDLHLESDGGERPMHLHFKTPSMANIHLLPAALVGEEFGDLPSIVASFDLAATEVAL